jgi:hypothetical protein
MCSLYQSNTVRRDAPHGSICNSIKERLAVERFNINKNALRRCIKAENEKPQRINVSSMQYNYQIL